MFRSLVRVATTGVSRAQAPVHVLSRSRLLLPKTIASQRFMSTGSKRNNVPRGVPKDEELDDGFDEDDMDDMGEYDDDWSEHPYGDDHYAEDGERNGVVDGGKGISVGDFVPSFRAEQVNPASKDITNYHGAQDMENRYTIMLFYPADFTFVCPTELTAFSDSIKRFQRLDCDVIALSTDQIHSHVAWLSTPRNKGGVEGLKFPLVADPTHEIAKSFGVYDDEEGQARRATVIVNEDGQVVHTSVNHAPVGRSVDEALRLVEAFKFVDQHGDQVCPANWKRGEKTMTPTHGDKIKYFEAVEGGKAKK